MKTILIIRNVIIFCLITCFGCSKDSIDEEEEVTVTKCFVIKEKDTDLLVANTRIIFEGNLSCAYGGCGWSIIITGNSNDNGEVCVTLSQLDFENIKHVSCLLNGTYYHATFDSLSNLSVIYVDYLF